MNRVSIVESYVDSIFESITSAQERKAAYIHTYGVADCCALIAVKRGQNPELAYVCGLLHDIYSYKTGVSAFHAMNGSEMVRVAFKYELKDLFTEDEQTIIKSALFHHSDKEHIHGEYDETLKDADVLQHWLNSMINDAVGTSARLINLQKELGLPLRSVPVSAQKVAPDSGLSAQKVALGSECGVQEVMPGSNFSAHQDKKISGFSRAALADVAEKLAAKRICGERTDHDFMEIIKYFPEKTAFDELKNGWCAAFVYHCVILAGLDIPIKYSPAAKSRFAGVAAWLEWGRDNGFCFHDQEGGGQGGWGDQSGSDSQDGRGGLTPARGDIVIYDKLIFSKDIPEDKPFYDHIGILLSVTGDSITVAEGNIDNKNSSGIICRKRNEKIGCYLRIPDNYQYECWHAVRL